MIVWVRRLAVPFVALFVAAGVSGCSSTLSDAATVTFHDTNGTHTVHITESQLQSELRDLMQNKQFVSLVKSQYLKHGDGKQTVDTALATRWLSILIEQAAYDDEFRNDKLSTTSADLSNATAEQQQNFSGQSGSTFGGFSKSFQQLLVDRSARSDAILRYYQSCPSGRLVYHIATANHDKAEQAFARIRAGETFETVAKSSSLDASSASLGGAIGCLAPGAFPTEIQNVAQQVPFDVVTVPVKTSYGYDLILVRQWSPAAGQQFAQQLQQGALTAVQNHAKGAHVWVNPIYGTWSPQTSGQGGQTLPIKLPILPNPNLTRDGQGASTTTTTAPTSAAG
jgi:parvulin-like peptidyl-prolyl isomerase